MDNTVIITPDAVLSIRPLEHGDYLICEAGTTNRYVLSEEEVERLVAANLSLVDFIAQAKRMRDALEVIAQGTTFPERTARRALEE